MNTSFNKLIGSLLPKMTKYILVLSTLLALKARAATDYHYHYQELTNIADHIYFDFYPKKTTFLSVFGMGQCAVLPVSWNIVDFTGFAVSDPLNQQRSHGYGYGEMCFQLGGSGMGYWINTDSATFFSQYMGARIYYISPESDAKFPWNSAKYGSLPVLQTEAKWYNHRWSIQYDNGQGAFFGQLGFSVLDVVHRKGVYYTVTLWDNRGSSQYYESVHKDTGGTSNFIVTTVLAGGTQYCTRQASSQPTGSLGGYFCFRVSPTQLIKAMTDCNNKLGAGLSLNPNDYCLSDVWCGCEAYRPYSTTRITSGYRTYAMNCYTVY